MRTLRPGHGLPFLVLSVTMSYASIAHALDAVTPPPPRAAPVAPQAQSAPATGSAPAPVSTKGTTAADEIAPPAPGAPAVKVEAAKKEAKDAALTPIVPSPRDVSRPAFQLFIESDLAALGISGVFVGARFIRGQSAYCAPLCDPTTVNALDRVTAGTWSPTWGTLSDVGLYSLVALSAGVLLVDEGVLDALNDAVVVTESAMTASALSTLAAIAASRPRPYVYGTNAPLSERQNGNSGLSFVSSHASLSFSLAASTYMATRRLNAGTRIPLITLAIGGAAATFVASARVAAGQHFITDSIGGAVVGTAVGIAIPALHSSPVKVVPVVGDGQKGVLFSGTF